MKNPRRSHFCPINLFARPAPFNSDRMSALIAAAQAYPVRAGVVMIIAALIAWAVGRALGGSGSAASAAAAAGAAAAAAKKNATYRRAEVAEHASRDDLWVVIGRKVCVCRRVVASGGWAPVWTAAVCATFPHPVCARSALAVPTPFHLGPPSILASRTSPDQPRPFLTLRSTTFPRT